MSTIARVGICLVAAIVTVTVMVLILHTTIGRTSNYAVGVVGAGVVLVTWYLTGSNRRS
jgi:hypothetical protein